MTLVATHALSTMAEDAPDAEMVEHLALLRYTSAMNKRKSSVPKRRQRLSRADLQACEALDFPPCLGAGHGAAIQPSFPHASQDVDKSATMLPLREGYCLSDLWR